MSTAISRRMQTKAQRARAAVGAAASGSPPALAPQGLPEAEVTAGNPAVGGIWRWIAEWNDYLEKVEGKADATRKSYVREAERLVLDLGIREPAEITREVVERHTKRRSYAGAGPARVTSLVIALRMFCKYLLSHGQLTTNPAAGIVTPRVYRRAGKVLSVSEVQKLLFGDKLNSLPARPEDLLVVAMFAVCYGGALRPDELPRLRTEEVEWSDEARVFTVLIRHAKHARGDVRQEIGEVPSRILGAYLQVRPQLAGGPYLFPLPGTDGKRPISYQTVWRRFSALCKERGIEPKGRELAPKILRRSRCTHLLDQKAMLHVVKDFMRHKSIETTTAHYSYTDENRVGRMLRKHDPLTQRKRASNLPVQGVMRALVQGLGPIVTAKPN